MIQSDNELGATQERVRLFANLLTEARRSYSKSNYQAMAEGYLLEIERMQAEIRAYLSQSTEHVEVA